MNKLLVAMSITAALALSGCGNTCEDQCEAAKECSGVTEAQKSLDCAKTCEDAEKDAEAAGCTDQYDSVMSCSADLDACADNTDKCTAEALAYGVCYMNYCTSNPDAAACSVE